MNAKNRSASRVGWVLCSALAVAATGCTTSHVHTRTVYVPTPEPVVYSPPAPQPPPPVVVVQPAPAPVVVIQAESDFYEPLGAYGHWEAVAGYGRCWIPGRVETGWRPYSDGYWQRTDAGWYWMSNEPWGWATYHYGRWDWHAQFGWFWVPQTQWAPSWVCWREGGGYVGWAPLRPSVTVGLHFHAGDYEPAHASRAYVFVEQRRMLEPVRPKTVIVNNTTIINQTVNVTKIKVVNKTVINEGPRPEVVERESGRKVHSVAAREVRQQEETTVAARERKIPRGGERKGQPVVRTEPQPASTPTPRNAQVTEKIPVAQLAESTPQPAPSLTQTPPARPHPDQVTIADEKREAGPLGQAKEQARDTAAKSRAEASRQPSNESRPATPAPAKPVEVATTVATPVAASPAPTETRQRVATERTAPKASNAVAPKSQSEVRNESKGKSQQPAKRETTSPTVVSIPAAPTARPQVGKFQVSPKATARVAEHAEAGKPKKENKSQKKKGEEPETATPVTNSPPQHR